MSLTFFMVSIPIFYLLAHELFKPRWALFATALYSFSPFMTWYSTETRMYTLLMLSVVIHQYCFVRLMHNKSGWIGLYLSAIAGIYSHYFFWFTLMAEAVFFLSVRGALPKYSFWKLLGLAATLVAALSPWAWYFLQQGAASNTKPFVPTPDAINFFSTFTQFIMGFQTTTVNTIVLSAWPLLLVVGFLLIRRGKDSNAMRRTVFYLIMMALLPATIAFVGSLVARPFFVSRYMIACIPALLLVIVWVIRHLARPVMVTAVCAVVVVWGVAGYVQDTSANTPVKENYRGAAEYIQAKSTASDIVVLSAPFTIYPFDYYYSGNAAIETIPRWDRQKIGAIPAFSSSKLPNEVKAISKNHASMYVLFSYDQGFC